MPADPPDDDVWARLRRLESAPGVQGPPGRAPSPGLREQPLPAVEPQQPRRAPSPPAEPAPAPSPPPEAPPAPRAPRRRRWPFVVVTFVLIAVSLTIGGFLYARWRIGQIDRVDVAAAVSPPTGADVWLVVGSDSREGLEPNRPDAAGLLAEVVPGQRADAIILVRQMPGVGGQMLSLPRDLWFDPPGDGNATRINGAYARGPDALIELIRDELGVGVQHYVEVDLAGLDNVVDALGGIDVSVPYPGFDATVGLLLTEGGIVRMDGAMALAYSRTRKWTDIIDGVEVPDGSGDLGRVQRQQVVLAAIAAKARSIRNPFTLNTIVASVADDVRLDSDVGIADLWTFMNLVSGAVQSEPLPVRGHVTGGGASVLLLEPGAEAILDAYR